jgi:hypothetical protein
VFEKRLKEVEFQLARVQVAPICKSSGVSFECLPVCEFIT